MLVRCPVRAPTPWSAVKPWLGSTWLPATSTGLTRVLTSCTTAGHRPCHEQPAITLDTTNTHPELDCLEHSVCSRDACGCASLETPRAGDGPTERVLQVALKLCRDSADQRKTSHDKLMTYFTSLVQSPGPPEPASLASGLSLQTMQCGC